MCAASSSRQTSGILSMANIVSVLLEFVDGVPVARQTRLAVESGVARRID